MARFSPGARRWLAGLSVALFLVVLLVAVPELWRWLDRAPLLGAVSTAVPAEGDTSFGRLYTAAYVSSLAPALAAVGAYLLWTVRCGPATRIPTLLLVSIGVLGVVQLAFVTAGWGEPTTGNALGESLDRAGISLWGHDVIERGWYIGYAALAAGFGSAVVASTRAARPHAWFAVLLIPATVLPWLLLSGGHLPWP
uniref:Uncharacterized protein n=2 Tax=unclassified Streptomyces TaxID=2593676 RepID=V9Z1J6_9ACTN|nr:hypothetical protein pFRL3_159c [Streptomyces sp. FR1]AHE39420.1 hypothetical protein pFRL4_187c [Streptomyces sp. F2]